MMRQENFGSVASFCQDEDWCILPRQRRSRWGPSRRRQGPRRAGGDHAAAAVPARLRNACTGNHHGYPGSRQRCGPGM